jgi:hypothetical protein
MVVEFFHADRGADVTGITVAYRNCFAKAFEEAEVLFQLTHFQKLQLFFF